MNTATAARAAFFDGIAEQWDSWDDRAALAQRLAAGLAALDVGAAERVLDVGCGTGNLTQALLARLSADGRVHAIDCSAGMLAVARKKITDARVSWHAVDALRLPLPDASADRAICCSVWPHFDDPRAVAAELARVLRPAGFLHVWHLLARERVNAIHAEADPAVQQDVLLAASDTAALLSTAGLAATAVVDSADGYLVTAVKPPAA
ncbi:MAG: methyltransferase domain-containing protein [Proteobacteria bacterium]|nr:methyltransferase domain-containing protein [Pseudomonadota bacterium]